MNTNFFKWATMALLAMSMAACTNDDAGPGVEQPLTIEVGFNQELLRIHNDGDSLMVRLDFDQVATTSGSLELEIFGNAEDQVHFSTNPTIESGKIQLNITPGMEYVEFNVKRLANFSEVSLFLEFTLKEVSSGYRPGESLRSRVILPANPEEEGSYEINFSETFVHISENEGTPFRVQLNFTEPVATTNRVVLEIQSPAGVDYGDRFVTSPEPVVSELLLDVTPGVTQVTFTIDPVNDNLVLGTYELVFKIQDGAHIFAGDQNELTIRIEEDDDNPGSVINSLAELRGMFDQHSGDFWIAEDYFVEGTITSSKNVIDTRLAYIQDATGGIALLFSFENVLELGDKVRLNLKGSTGQILNGQKTMAGIIDRSGVLLPKDPMLPVEVISLAELETGNYSGRRIRIENVHFVQAGAGKTFLGNHAVQGDTGGAIITVYPTAPFSNNQLPEGAVSITGIVGDWGYLLPQSLADIDN